MIDFFEASLCLKTIAHPQRLKMIHFLIKKGQASVGEIVQFSGLSQNIVSEHLTLLKDRGLLLSRKEGRKVYYCIGEPTLKKIIECIEKRFSTR